MKKRYHSTLLLACLIIVLAVAAACYPPATPVPQAAPRQSNAITNIVWQWQTLNDVPTGTSMRVDDPSKYTIIFYTDGTTTGQADCNTFSGTYSQANGFAIIVRPDVMAACDQGSVDQIVWQWQTLDDVAAGTSMRVDDPSKYTIVFYTDGTTTGQADCNTFTGTYSQANGFTIAVTPDVMAACDWGQWTSNT